MTGPDPVPTEVENGLRLQKNDFWTTQEEADVLIVQQICPTKAKSSMSIEKA